MEVKVISVRENMYILDDGRVRCFLFIGKEDALLVDTGFFDVDVPAVARSITDLPIRLVLTHADGDHTGGLKAFQECYMHAADRYMLKEEVEVHELEEGDYLHVGQFHFEIIHLPGHTRGSIALLDAGNRIIITGDTVQKTGPIYMFGERRNFPHYLLALEKLEGLKDKFDEIYPSHYEWPLSTDAIGKCLEDARDLWEGRMTESIPHETMPCRIYRGRYTGFLYQPE